MIGSPDTRAAALLICLIAAMLSAAVYGLGAARERVRQIERRYADWKALREQGAQLEADRALLAEATRAGGAPPAAEWLRARYPDWTVELKELERESIDGEWFLRRLQVTIPRAPLADLGEAIDALGRLSAPWRTVELNLSALDATPGVARAVMVLEGLARAPAGTP